MTLSEFAHKIARRFATPPALHTMDEDLFITTVTSLGLCVVEDEDMLKICITYDAATCIVAFTRSFLELADEQTIIRIVATCKALDVPVAAKFGVIRGGKNEC